jgi:hypothetical protein
VSIGRKKQGGKAEILGTLVELGEASNSGIGRPAVVSVSGTGRKGAEGGESLHARGKRG